MGNESSFILNLIPIRGAIHKKYINKIVDNTGDEKMDGSIGLLKKQTSVAASAASPVLFAKRFGFWIDQRKRVNNLDESILNEYKKFYPLYATLVQ